MGHAYKKAGRVDDALQLYKLASKQDPYYTWWFKRKSEGEKEAA